MPRSYFNRILPARHQGALVPARPVTSLWKTVQIERMRQIESPGLGAETVAPLNPDPLTRSISADRIAPHSQPASPSHQSDESKESVPGTMVGPAVARTAPARAPESRAAESTISISSSDAKRAQARRNVGKQAHFQPAVRPPSPLPGRTSVALSPNPLESLAAPTRAGIPERRQSKKRGRTDEPVHELSGDPIEHDSQLTTARTLREAISEEARAEVARLFARGPQAVWPMRSKQASGPRTTFDPAAPGMPAPVLLEPATARHITETPSHEEPRFHMASSVDTPRTSVHIGKIEVQVIPPTTTIRPVAPAAQPKSRLARGYSLWPAR